jgi:ABC-type antimicrobial peptide transport system permease subunit
MSRQKDPPRLAIRFLKWFCPSHLYEGIEGDLMEAFDADVEQVGVRKARRRFAYQAVRFFRPGIILRNTFASPFIQRAMLKNYMIIAWRNVLRNKSYTTLNVAGLALGLALFMMMFWVVRFENSFDRYQLGAKRMYQIIGYDKYEEPTSHVPGGVIKFARERLSGVEMASSVTSAYPNVVKVKDENRRIGQGGYVSPDFIKTLDVKWIAGSPDRSLSKPHQLVLDEPTANLLFPEGALGKTLRFDNEFDLTVTGIIQKMPANTEFQFKFLISYETLALHSQWQTNEGNWGGGDSGFHGYLMLKEGVDPRTIEAQLKKEAVAHKEHGQYAYFQLVPFSEMHFDANNDTFAYIMPRWLPNSLLYIALFVLVIACINFVNLATVQSVQRSREIAVRKILGSGRGALVWQFFVETAVIVLISIGAASAMATVLIGQVDYLLNTRIAESVVWNGDTLMFLLITGVTVTFASGFYPALVLSGFEPARAMRDKFASLSVRGISLRQALVVFQFGIAQLMVIGMLIGLKQMQYFHTQDLGFNTLSVVTVDMPDARDEVKRARFQQELLNHPEIDGVTFGLTSPSSTRNWWWWSIKHPSLPNGEATFRLQFVDSSYFRFYEIPLLAGRVFQSTDTSSTAPVAMINEQAAIDLGFATPEEALGAKLGEGDNAILRTVIGVVKNYHSQSLKDNIVPHFYTYRKANFQLASIRIDPAHTKEAIALIGKYWSQEFPDNYFEYAFLDTNLRTFYEDEDKFSNLLTTFAGIGIFIGCLGLYGLVSFVCTRRSKEIGIRKVLGASISNILLLLSGNFLLLVTVAFVIAAPIAWFILRQFLERYTNHIDIPLSVFGVAGGITIAMALVPVGWQSLKASRANPAESLRQE